MLKQISNTARIVNFNVWFSYRLSFGKTNVIQHEQNILTWLKYDSFIFNVYESVIKHNNK